MTPLKSVIQYYLHLVLLKEKCLQFHSDLKYIRCAPHVWHGRCPGDTPIPTKPSQACLVWRSRLRCWCALAILVVSLEVVGRKHCPWRNPTGRNHTLSGLVTTKLLHRANSRTHQLHSVGEAAISLQHCFTRCPRDGSSDHRTIPNVTFTVCNRHEFHDLATLPTQVMA
jgi:hypothetical protein